MLLMKLFVWYAHFLVCCIIEFNNCSCYNLNLRLLDKPKFQHHVTSCLLGEIHDAFCGFIYKELFIALKHSKKKISPAQ